ncbi:RagB/SusD family nutrient uptake outer membrane protein [Parapedobacter sp. 2B3]|uniref:RagB/SusD family nutrient uptake outer membrane protein n=1 Tax=Parapedobacter sp. 2B3 TaxID=3342381 RepID=UPI0035B5DFD0
MMIKTKNIATMLLMVFTMPSCTDYLHIDPPKTELVRESVFSDDASALTAMEAVYGMLQSGHYLTDYGRNAGNITGASADEFNFVYNTNGFVENMLDPADEIIQQIWTTSYRSIYSCNAVLEGIQENSRLSEAVKRQLEGESLFLRALNYFYLVNLFGDVPLLMATAYQQNALADRDPEEVVYDQIILDLTKAKDLLPVDFTSGNGQRTRATTWAASALLARVYAYNELWGQTEVEASRVIGQNGLFKWGMLDELFLANNVEAIWQIYPSLDLKQANEALLTYNNTYSRAFTTVTPDFLLQIEVDDPRKKAWFARREDYTYSVKYKAFINNESPYSEYSTILRLSEQYLLRAEACVWLNNIAGGLNDLNSVRARAGVPQKNTNDKEELLHAIRDERRIELFGEYAHRWFDLKRWGLANKVLGALKPTWTPEAALYPIPEKELLKNPNLTQNEGY